MALILSLETSTSVCSVALHNSAQLLTSAEVHVPQSHASKLAVLVDQVIKTAGVEFKKISAIAISSGPGSYTGLRIATSTAKGLCYALGIPLIAVNTLKLMAYQINKTNINSALLCPMIDARRMEVYCLIANADLNIIKSVQALVIDETSFQELLTNHNILFFGDGSEKCKSFLNHPNASFISGITPSAKELGELASQDFEQKQFVDLVHFEPFYLKEFRIGKPITKDSLVSNKIM